MLRSIFASLSPLVLAGSLLAQGTTVTVGGEETATPPNILMIVVDDLNDWTEGLGGHPDARTPNLDRLASMGTRFTNAHCQGPKCDPSRVSFMWGMRPTSTGVYGNNDTRNPDLDTLPTVMQYFREQAGYETLACGKIFHHSANHKPSFEAFFRMSFWNDKDVRHYPETRSKAWDWGPQDYPEEEFNDYVTADWAIDRLGQERERPLFLAVGFVRPHCPYYAPRRLFEALPEGGVAMPPYLADDWEDIPAIARSVITNAAPDIAWFKEDMTRWQSAVDAYVASTTFMDEQLGRVLDALEASSIADNTIILLFSDHGQHLGEKDRFGKHSLWERSTRVPFLFSAPGLPADQTTDSAVELIDVFPTLCALAGLPTPEHAEGRDLTPLLKDASTEWDHPALSSVGPNDHSIRHQNWRYTRYQDGSEELYNLVTDPNEWTNLADDPSYTEDLDNYRDKMTALLESLPTHESF